MQIHELNNFTGTLGSGAYLAVDDGNDTGKLSTQQLLAATEARIDNIIAGPAPSAEEIVDARLGDDGVTYPSLGDAIRDQVGDLKSAVNNIRVVKTFTADCFEKGSWSSGNKSQYRDGNRIRTKVFYYLLNDLFISSLSNSDGSQYLITYFTQSGTYESQVGWQKYGAVIPKGSIIALSFTASNDDSAPQMSVNDVLALFSIVPDEKNAVDDFNASSANVVNGIFSSTGAFLGWYPTRLLVMDYLKCDNSFITVSTPSSYQYYVLGFNADFELTGYGLLGDWVSGERIVDVSDYSYVSFILQKTNSSNISLSEITNLSVTKNLPKSIEYFNNGNIRSFAKDGINDSNNSAYPRYPKSSLISFQKAYDQGFRSLLIHVQFTSDGVPVVYHDQYINRYARNANGTEISGTVYVANSTLATLDTYDFGIAFGQRYAGTKITRLSDALTFIKQRGMNVIIEPTIDLTDEQETTVCNMLKANGLKNVGYQAYAFNVLNRFHQKMPEADLLLWMDNETQMLNWAQRFSELKDKNRLYFYTYSETAITEASCLIFAQYGIEVIQQALNGTEPSNIKTGLTNVPYVTAVVSQVMPAYFAVTI